MATETELSECIWLPLAPRCLPVPKDFPAPTIRDDSVLHCRRGIVDVDGAADPLS